MLTRSQVYTLLLLRHRGNTLFSRLPIDLIRNISDFGQDPQSNFAKALHYVAYGELTEAKALLDQHPRLVLQAGTVVTPGGLTVIRTTLLECALGAGDPEMAVMILPYFSHVAGGENEKEQQLARYRPCIEGMLNQPPYDLTALIDIIKASSWDAISAALNKEMNRESKLRDALMQFRQEVTPGTVTRPRMHYHYPTLLHAFEIFYREWNDLEEDVGCGGGPRPKCDLVWRQVIGYLQRGLPAVDRFAFARGLYDIVENKAPIERVIGESGSFWPSAAAVDSDFVGLGFDYGISSGGRAEKEALRMARVGPSGQHISKLMSSKNIRLAELMPPQPKPKTASCACVIA